MSINNNGGHKKSDWDTIIVAIFLVLLVATTCGLLTLLDIGNLIDLS